MKKSPPVLWTIAVLCGIGAFFVWFNEVRTGESVGVPSVAGFSASSEAITVTIHEDGGIHFNGEALSEKEFTIRINGILKAYPDQKVNLRGDAGADFTRIISLLDLIKKAGPMNVAFSMTTWPEE